MFWNKKGQGMGGLLSLFEPIPLFLCLLLTAVYTIVVFMLPESVYYRIIFNIVLIILIFMLFREMRDDILSRQGIILFIIVLFIEIAIPLAFGVSDYLRTSIFGEWYLAYGWALWSWFYFTLFYLGRDARGIYYVFKVAIILFWVFVFLNLGLTYIGYLEEVDTGIDLFDQWKGAKDTWKRSVSGFQKTFGDAWEGIVGSIENAISYQRAAFTEAYYVGVVEENEGQKLGVYLEDITPSQSEFAYDEDVVVYGKIKTRTLDDEVGITVSCFANDDEPENYGDIYPPGTFYIFDLQEEDLDCTLVPRENNMATGLNKITFTADFNFETVGYIRRYFTDRETLAAATREGIDLLDEYGISDRDTTAKYTEGPIRLGMGPDEPLIDISETYPVNPRFGITLDSGTDWRGKIKEINELIISIPDSMDLDKDTCNAEFELFSENACVESHKTYKSRVYGECKDETDVDACLLEKCQEEFDGYNAYSLVIDKTPQYYRDIEDYISLTCRIIINDYAKVLGGVPLSTHYFRTRARYDYQVDDSITLEIVEPEGGMPEEATRIYTSNEERIQDLFNTYYFTDPYPIQEYCNNYIVDECLVMSIIAAGSGNNPSEIRTDLPKGVSKGLMMLNDSEAEESAGLIGDTVGDLYDPDNNIKLGTRRLKTIYDSGVTLDEEMIAAYFGGLDAVSYSTKCSGKKKYQCEADTEFIIVGVLTNVTATIKDTCDDLNLIETCGQIKSEQNIETPMVGGTVTENSVSGNIRWGSDTVSLGSNVELFFYVATYTDTNNSLVQIRYENKSTTPSKTVDILNTYATTPTGFDPATIIADKWYYIANPDNSSYDEYNLPFIRYKFHLDSSGAQIESMDYQYMQHVIQDSPIIYDIGSLQPASREPVALVDDLIYVMYTDEVPSIGLGFTSSWPFLKRTGETSWKYEQFINFYYKDDDGNQNIFYATPWPLNVTCIDSRTEPDDVNGTFGIVLRNKIKGSEIIGVDYTSFQFEYNPLKQFEATN